MLSGTAFLAVIGVVAISWKDIATRYHLHRLRSEPAYLELMLREGVDSPGRAALEEYARTAEGNAALESHVLGIARREVARNDTWVAEFEPPRRRAEGWSVLVWRTPKEPGGHRIVRIDEKGNVTGYMRGY